MESDTDTTSESDLCKPIIQGPSRKPFYNYGGLTRFAHPSIPSPTSTADSHLNSFKKLAGKLGFGILGEGRRRSSTSGRFRMTLGLIDVIPDEEQAGPVGFGTAPLTPSSYIRRMSILGPRPQVTHEVTSRSSVDEQWKMNYKEAAIYLEEGENNEEFCSHPKRTESLPAYLMAHTPWFQILDLLVSILLLCLPAIEVPCLPALKVHLVIHVSLEIAFLCVIGLGVYIRLRWLGIRQTLRQPRTLLKVVLLCVMLSEAVIVVLRQVPHIRISRALRPIFILDNRHLRGVRRFAREVLQCLPPVLDMLILLFFLIFIFSLLGHYLFGKDPNDPFFPTLEDSFVNLFILLTTANYPDIMMESYYRRPFNIFFFVAYLVILLYFFTNVLLAVVYDNFTAFEKEKMRKLVLHKRKSCQKAYHLLVSKANNHGIIFRHFCGMVIVYQPHKSLRDIYLMFRALDHSGDGYLSKEEFCRFFEYCNLSWTPLLTTPKKPWPCFKYFGILVLRFLDSGYSEYIFNGVIVLNAFCTWIHWIEGTSQASWDSYVFALLFSIEMSLKLLTWGSKRILRSGWQTFDLLSTIAFVVAILVHRHLGILSFIRPLRLMRIFKLKKRYRNVLGTLFVLYRPMVSAAILLLLLYYFFAIIGMEVFRGIDLRNCCNGTLIESYFVPPANESTFALRFYMNTFQNIFRSYVTLFELMVVNNWYVIMEGHVNVTSRLSRLYFFLFYLSTMILLNIVVAFILDTFIFRMRYKRTIDKMAEDKLLRTEVQLNWDEIHFCYHEDFQDVKQRELILEAYGADLEKIGRLTYVGKGRRTKELLFKRVCETEVSDWIRQSEHSSRKSISAVNYDKLNSL